jgi:WD40 repeat protein
LSVQDDSLINELNYSYASGAQKEKFSDSAVLIRASASKIINKILAKNQFDLKDTTWKRPPPASLVLEHVYGMQTSDRRSSIKYLHLSAEEEQSNIEKRTLTKDILGLSSRLGTEASKLELLLPKLLGPQYKYLVEKGVKAFEPIRYEKKHSHCYRHFIYYTSRLAIVFNPTKNKQEFYEGHKLKISAMSLHPKRSLVATGEVNINPDIHIWNPQTLETLAVLTTSHKGGILHLTF